MVSEDIVGRRDEYMGIMHDHGTKAREEIVESVRRTQAELLAIFSSRSEEQATQHRSSEEWCMRELALHALFTERLIAKLVEHLSRGTVPPAEAFERAGIGMMPEDDGKSYGGILAELQGANDDLMAAVRGLPDAPDLVLKLPHPFFGPLNCLEWAGFQRVHDTDHIQHARKIIASAQP